MKKLIKAFLNKETILYLVSNSLSWILSVAFAYVTNKLFVFESKSWKKDILKKEIPSFLSARIASYFIEQGGLWLMMDVLLFKDKVFDFIVVRLSGLMTAKLVLAVLVVIINYVLSKVLIFKSRGDTTSATDLG